MKNLKLHLNQDHYNKMVAYARQAYDLYKTEISGFAPVIIENDKCTMQEPVIFKQDCSSATTTLHKTAISKYIGSCIKDNKELIKQGKFMFCWWHSHHTMKAFWSGTDHATIEEFAENGSVFAIVVNNKAEHEAIFAETIDSSFGRKQIIKTDVDLIFTGNKEFDLKDEIKENIVKEKKVEFSNSYYRHNENLPLFNQDDLSNGLPYGHEDEHLFNESFSGYDMEEMNQEALELQKKLDEPKPKPKPRKKRVKKLETALRKRSDYKFETTEEFLSELESVINTNIESFNVGDTKHELALKEINQAVTLYNEESTDVKLHNPPTLEDITTIDDIVVEQELGELDEPDYSKISKHIPVTESLF